jgi:hypothetical protein
MERCRDINTSLDLQSWRAARSAVRWANRRLETTDFKRAARSTFESYHKPFGHFWTVDRVRSSNKREEETSMAVLKTYRRHELGRWTPLPGRSPGSEP